MSEYFSLILTELQKLNARVTNIELNMPSKNDIVGVAAKYEIASMTAKDDIANMVTKSDIANLAATMATKEDIVDTADIPCIRQAVLEANTNVKQLVENQRSFFEMLGEHDIAIHSINKRLALLSKLSQI